MSVHYFETEFLILSRNSRMEKLTADVFKTNLINKKLEENRKLKPFFTFKSKCPFFCFLSGKSLFLYDFG